MNYRVSFIIMAIGDAIGVLLCIPGLLKDIVWLLIAGFAVLLVSSVQALIFYRCPHCRRFLGLRWVRPDKCPKCKESLNWQE